MKNTFQQLAVCSLIVLWVGTQVCAEEPAIPAPRSLIYYRWESASPGAEPTSTSLHALEIDFEANRFRRLTQSVEAPMEMLPHDAERIGKLVGEQPWIELPAIRVKHLASMVVCWQETKPPARYVQHHLLGREDGYLETLRVVFAEGEASLEIDPHGRRVNGDTYDPPPEWHALMAFLDAVSRTKQKLLHIP